MHLLPAIKKLPREYQVISSIRSVGLKNRLAERIDGIITLLDFFDIVEPDPKTKATVQRFFRHLNETVKNPSAIEARATWLTRYAEIVYDQLLIARHGPAHTQQTLQTRTDSDFHLALDTLAVTLRRYRAFTGRCQSELDTLCQIVEFSENIVSDPRYEAFNAACEKITELTEAIRALSANRVVYDREHGFCTELDAILFYLNTFVLHKGVLLKQ